MVKQKLRAEFGEDVVDQRKEKAYGPVVHLRRNHTTKEHVPEDLLCPLCHQPLQTMQRHESYYVILLSHVMLFRHIYLTRNLVALRN